MSHSDDEEDVASVDNKTEIDSEYDFADASECEDLEDRLRFCRDFLAKYDNYIPDKVEKKVYKTYDFGYQPYRMNYSLPVEDKEYFTRDLIYRISDHIEKFVEKNSHIFVRSRKNDYNQTMYEVTIPSFVEYEKDQRGRLTKSRYSPEYYDFKIRF